MGGNSPSTPQGAGSQLQQLFMQNQTPGQNPGGYQQQPIAPIAAPQYGGPIQPTPEQAAAATQARMLARMPPVMAAPAAAPKRNYVDRGGNGSAGGRGGEN